MNQKGLTNIKSKKFHFTYQTKCLVNNKTYIGRHSTDDLNDGYIGSGKLLRRAITKYGKDNFSIIPLCFFDSYEEVVEEERYIVDKKWCEDETNYNIVVGGENPIMYGESSPSWKGGVTFKALAKRAENRENRRINRIAREKEKNINRNLSTQLQEEKRLNKGFIKEQTSCKQVWVDDCSFLSIRDCARQLGVNQGLVQGRLKSKNFPNWRYGEHDSTKNNHSPITIKKGTAKRVVKLSLDGIFIAEYESAKEASRLNNTHDGDIIACCKGSVKSDGYKVKSAGGFKWMYYDEYYSKSDSVGDRRARGGKSL